jgi:hypothetical protein
MAVLEKSAMVPMESRFWKMLMSLVFKDRLSQEAAGLGCPSTLQVQHQFL